MAAHPRQPGYRPLDQIGPDNVAGLRLAWALAMPEGTNQTAPLVHDGVMFLASPGNVVQALDAATGELLWEHRHQVPEDAESRRATRSIALYRDKVYLATYDAAIVEDEGCFITGHDPDTGEELWRTSTIAQPRDVNSGDLGRHCAAPARRRRHVDSARLRSGPRPLLSSAPRRRSGSVRIAGSAVPR